ncbi:hypothetical protein LINPERHAP2_LOCUS3728, partial [Linum perenne]
FFSSSLSSLPTTFTADIRRPSRAFASPSPRLCYFHTPALPRHRFTAQPLPAVAKIYFHSSRSILFAVSVRHEISFILFHAPRSVLDSRADEICSFLSSLPTRSVPIVAAKIYSRCSLPPLRSVPASRLITEILFGLLHVQKLSRNDDSRFR